MNTGKRAYTAQLSYPNVKVQNALSHHGKSEDGLCWLCYLDEKTLEKLARQFPQIEFSRAHPGAGGWRPRPKPEEYKGKYSLTLAPELEIYARRLGRGNRSRGVAKAIAYYKQQHE